LSDGLNMVVAGRLEWFDFVVIGKVLGSWKGEAEAGGGAVAGLVSARSGRQSLAFSTKCQKEEKSKN
jgi:broad specificity polyphosphatase/5'/3'-nucleotidase SurE